ncbi:MAG TPA: aldehyde dehydrogenase family protein [Chloroflexota bacterium]|nr:aldehyde dehydrogenase family protein [Chloroflexota bacterium]HZU06762.1 aldehyde dehydrogenase family protein [Chloroflexota bacterium]
MAKMIIGGEHVDARSGAVMEIRNPATGEVVDTVPQASVEDVRQAVDVAYEAFRKWADTPPHKRAEVLYRGAQLVREHLQEIATLETKEQGKPLRESQIEVGRFAENLEYYAGLADKIRGEFVPLSERDKYGMVVKQPIGVCAAIVPWNFPVSLMGNKIAPALVAGNTVVVKPASTTPLASIRVIELLHEAGVPAGVLNIVTGPGSVVGEELLANPRVRKIAFTGETVTGKHVMEVAAREVKRVTLELGGSDPMIVCDDADLDAAASAASVGRFFNCGQACLAVKRLYLFESIADAFMERFLPRVQRLKVGNGLNPDVRTGPLHTAKQRQEVEAMVEEAVAAGAKVLVGGRRPEGEEYARGHFYLPTVLVDVPHDARIVQEECFGPALPVFRVKDLEEAITLANSSKYGLGSSIWTRDLAKAREAAERIEAGYTWINNLHIAYDELPFGGFKHSGYGKEHGVEALDYYLESKSIVVATPSGR